MNTYYDEWIQVAPSDYKLPDIKMPHIIMPWVLPNHATIRRDSSIKTALNPDQLTWEYLSIWFWKYDHDLWDEKYGKFSMSTVGERIDRIFLSWKNTQLHLDFSGDFRYKTWSEKGGEENKWMEKKWSGVFFGENKASPWPTTEKNIWEQRWKLVNPKRFNEEDISIVFQESIDIVRKAMHLVGMNNDRGQENSFIQIQEVVAKFREDTLSAYQELKKES